MQGETYETLTRKNGVRVGQIWRHNFGMGAEMEVVHVTLAFAVLHSTAVHTPGPGLCAPEIDGVPGRYASPWVETVSQLKSGERDGKPRYTLVKDIKA